MSEDIFIQNDVEKKQLKEANEKLKKENENEKPKTWNEKVETINEKREITNKNEQFWKNSNVKDADIKEEPKKKKVLTGLIKRSLKKF